MRLTIHAVGRLKTGPETELAGRYLGRLARTGASIGLEFGGVNEHTESRARSSEQRRKEEAETLTNQFPPQAVIVALDETGKNVDSQTFAERIGRWRDDGRPSVAFVIGGPDGLDRSLRSSADLVVSFGAMTWPHQIVRVLLAEQLYRTVTILSGHPYHRG